jgi:hypothetical protein
VGEGILSLDFDDMVCNDCEDKDCSSNDADEIMRQMWIGVSFPLHTCFLCMIGKSCLRGLRGRWYIWFVP